MLWLFATASRHVVLGCLKPPTSSAGEARQTASSRHTCSSCLWLFEIASRQNRERPADPWHASGGLICLSCSCKNLHNLTTTHTQRNLTPNWKKLAKEALGELRRMQRVALLKRSGTDAQPKQTRHFRAKELTRRKVIVDN